MIWAIGANMHDIDRFGSRIELLRGLAEGRSVLHFGAGGETDQPIAKVLDTAPRSLHAALTETASECVGIEMRKEVVDAVTEAGIFDNMLAGDATAMCREELPLSRIDVIVAGDIIEHLSAPGDLLDNATRLADEDTKLVLTTPNCISAMSFFRYLRGRRVDGKAHLCSFNRYSLDHLIRAHGWEPVWWATCYQAQAEIIHGGWKMRLGSAAFRRFPHLGGTLLVVAEQA
jgi:2-polyprenyl-3-methyl-5-hydroxy-6-metoxy-1,4-benzoquinol methylase